MTGKGGGIGWELSRSVVTDKQRQGGSDGTPERERNSVKRRRKFAGESNHGRVRSWACLRGSRAALQRGAKQQ